MQQLAVEEQAIGERNKQPSNHRELLAAVNRFLPELKELGSAEAVSLVVLIEKLLSQEFSREASLLVTEMMKELFLIAHLGDVNFTIFEMTGNDLRDALNTFLSQPGYSLTRLAIQAIWRIKELNILGTKKEQFIELVEKWWLRHVGRPKNINGELFQDPESLEKELNGIPGQFETTVEAQEHQKKELRKVDQMDLLASLAYQHLLTVITHPTKGNQERDEELGLLEGWTHVSIPPKDHYSYVIHRGSQFKKLYLSQDQVSSPAEFTQIFKEELTSEKGWHDFKLSDEQRQRALKGDCLYQEAEKRKPDLLDPTAADASFVIFEKKDDETTLDLAQRSEQLWCHGVGIASSLGVFVDDKGYFTGEITKDGSHPMMDGAASTQFAKYILQQSIKWAKKNQQESPQAIDEKLRKQLNNGRKFINQEQEQAVIKATILRAGNKEKEQPNYQAEINELYEYFQKHKPPFFFDINTALTAAALLALRQLYEEQALDLPSGIHFLETMIKKQGEELTAKTVHPVIFSPPKEILELISNRSLARKDKNYQADLQVDTLISEFFVAALFLLSDQRRRVKGKNIKEGEIRASIAAIMEACLGRGKIRQAMEIGSALTSPKMLNLLTEVALLSSLAKAEAQELGPDDVVVKHFTTAFDELYSKFGVLGLQETVDSYKNQDPAQHKLIMTLRSLNKKINQEDFADALREGLAEVIETLKLYQKNHPLAQEENEELVAGQIQPYQKAPALAAL